MFTFFVNMQKRKDGKVYADLHKTDGRIYFSAKEAQRVIQANQEIGLQHRHVVEMVAMTMEDYEEQSKEIAALRAELDALKRQEPVAYKHRDGMLSKRLPGGPVLGIDWTPLYAAPVPNYHGGDSLPLAKFYAAANPAAVLELIGEVRRLQGELSAAEARASDFLRSVYEQASEASRLRA